MLLLGAVPGLCNAQSDCAQIGNNPDRLACYDRAAARTAENAMLPAEGNWTLSEKSSEFRDTKDVFLSVSTDGPIGCGMFSQEHATLMLRCMENTSAAYIVTNCHLASGFRGYGKVEYRVDDTPSSTRNFEASTDNKALGLWNGAAAIPFMKTLLEADTLLMRFTPFNESPTTARFDIRGLDTAIAPLRAACGW